MVRYRSRNMNISYSNAGGLVLSILVQCIEQFSSIMMILSNENHIRVDIPPYFITRAMKTNNNQPRKNCIFHLFQAKRKRKKHVTRIHEQGKQKDGNGKRETRCSGKVSSSCFACDTRHANSLVKWVQFRVS